MISYEDITAPAARGPGSDARSVATKRAEVSQLQSASVSFLSLHHPRILLGHPPPPRGRVEDRARNEPSRSLKFHNHEEAVATAFT